MRNRLSLHKIIYNSKHLTNLDDKQILEMIELAEKKYRHIPDCINENALLWKAEKPGCAPYLFIWNNTH